jgi:hypothetical protein
LSEPEPEADPRHTPFLAILRYVMGFMGLIALAAFAAVWLFQHCSRTLPPRLP